MKPIRALIFDMDSTLLHTMSDLAVAANEALTRMGFPAHTQDEMPAYMGYGGRWLIEQIGPRTRLTSSASRRSRFGASCPSTDTTRTFTSQASCLRAT